MQCFTLRCRRLAAAYLLVQWALGGVTIAQALECRSYRDGQGHEVWLHPRSFVDRVVCPGNSGCKDPAFELPGHNNDPGNVLGPPSYSPRRGKMDHGIYTLGCRGAGTWEFVDNQIVDVPGPDIIVFEVGRAVEATKVEISANGESWIDVGTVAGHVASVDINPFVKPGETFRFVRLTDLGMSCRNATPGADLDAIATFGYSWVDVADDASTVFFVYDRAELRDEAKLALDRLLSEYRNLKGYKLKIIGHTDANGSDKYNKRLSEDRARAVADYIVSMESLDFDSVLFQGEGKSRPMATNDTPMGQSLNRRVELMFIPTEACPQPKMQASRSRTQQ